LVDLIIHLYKRYTKRANF